MKFKSGSIVYINDINKLNIVNEDDNRSYMYDLLDKPFYACIMTTARNDIYKLKVCTIHNTGDAFCASSTGVDNNAILIKNSYIKARICEKIDEIYYVNKDGIIDVKDLSYFFTSYRILYECDKNGNEISHNYNTYVNNSNAEFLNDIYNSLGE